MRETDEYILVIEKLHLKKKNILKFKYFTSYYSNIFLKLKFKLILYKNYVFESVTLPFMPKNIKDAYFQQ